MPDKRLFRIIPCSFLASVAIGIVNLGMLFLIKSDYGAGPVVVGWFTALWAAAYFVGCIAFRSLARHIDASVSAILMCFLSAALLAAQFLFPTLVGAFVAYSMYGLACSLMWPRLMGWLVVGLEGNALSRASGSFNLSWSVGMTISPFLAGALSERGVALGYGYALPIQVGIVILVATGVFMLATNPVAPAPRPRTATAVSTAIAAKGHDSPLRHPAWIGLFAIYVLCSVLNNIFPVYAKDALALSESVIGFFLLIRAATMSVGFWVFGRLRFWQFKAVYLPVALAANLVLCLAFAFIRTPLGFIFGLALLGAVQSFTYSLSIFYGSSGAADRDKRMSIHEAVLTVGQVLGSVAGGAVYQVFSWPLVFVFSAAIVLICAPFQIAGVRKR